MLYKCVEKGVGCGVSVLVMRFKNVRCWWEDDKVVKGNGLWLEYVVDVLGFCYFWLDDLSVVFVCYVF